MDSHELKELLDGVRDGRISPTVAADRIQVLPYQDAGGFAKVDLHRRIRCGFPEVIFGQGKTAPQIEAILKTLLEHEQGGLVTRLDPQAAAHLLAAFPHGEHNALGRTFRVRTPGESGPTVGRVVIVTAGTSDLPVAEEARVTAEAWNCDVSLVADVGVAGLHRLLHQLPHLKNADALVSWPGWKGHCPALSAAWSSARDRRAHQYRLWRSFQGVAALLGMLNSCASNVVVVNIDAGFSGGHVASLIARRMGQARQTAAGS